jgi:hypothetical protein
VQRYEHNEQTHAPRRGRRTKEREKEKEEGKEEEKVEEKKAFMRYANWHQLRVWNWNWPSGGGLSGIGRLLEREAKFAADLAWAGGQGVKPARNARQMPDRAPPTRTHTHAHAHTRRWDLESQIE